MFGAHDLPLFILSGLLLNITPGVDFAYVISRSAAQGFRAGVWASLGIGAGCMVHIAAAALGLSAILATSAMAFTVVKWLGAAYLVYVGLSMLRSRAAVAELASLAPSAATRIFWQGFLTNALNPKVALFFLAFVPQFIDAGSSSKVSAFLFLGAVFNVNGTLWNLFVAWTAARVVGRLRVASAVGIWLNRALGALFIGLGLRLALSDHG